MGTVDVLSEGDPECAPLIGRPTRPHAHHLACHLLGKRQAGMVRMVHIFAETRVAFAGSLAGADEKEVAYAHRRAITAAMNDLFGNISGAPLHAFDLLKCTEVRAKQVDRAKELDGMVERRYSLLIALQRAHVNEMVAALSTITAGFCGGEILRLFVAPTAPPEVRASARVLLDVVGVAESPTSLVSAS